MAESRRLIFSCEHGGNRVPAAYAQLFCGQEALLASHRGYDPGALALARMLARGMKAPLHAAEISRLLVDLNRERTSGSLFSGLIKGGEEQILKRYYLPYRKTLTDKIGKLVDQGGQVVHISIHSFAPVLDGQTRNAELGLLYDPSRGQELHFCRAWKRLLKQLLPGTRVRSNYPYRGSADGLVRSLRRQFDPQDYLGIELEVNQGLLAGYKSFPAALQRQLLESLRELFPVD